MWDVFISHASEDKEAVVRPMAAALVQAGLRVWYDEFTLTLGDGLRESIDRGLAQSRYGIVVLSPSFFGKRWPQQELSGAGCAGNCVGRQSYFAGLAWTDLC